MRIDSIEQPGGSFFANVEAAGLSLTQNGNMGLNTVAASYGTGWQTFAINGDKGGVLDLLAGEVRVGSIFATSTEVRISAVAAVPMNFFTGGKSRMQLTPAGELLVGGVDVMKELKELRERVEALEAG
jgi:hypothetical protein